MKFFLCVMGMVFFIEGFPHAAFPKKTQSAIRMILEMQAGSLRGMGLLLMLFGVFLVYIAQSGG